MAEPPKPPPVIRAPRGTRLTGGLHGDVELLAGDLVVVAQGGVGGVEQRAESVPVVLPERLHEPVDPGHLADDMPRTAQQRCRQGVELLGCSAEARCSTPSCARRGPGVVAAGRRTRRR